MISGTGKLASHGSRMREIPGLCGLDRMTGSLTIVHVVLSMDIGGLESIVLDLVRESSRVGQRVAVACIERTGALAAQVEALGAPVACVHKRPGLRLETIGRLVSVLRELRPAVVHTHQIGALFYAGPAARRARVPVVVHTEHGKHYGERRRTRWVGRLAARHAARFLCVSEDIAAAAEFHRIVPRSKIHVVPNGIDMDRFRDRIDSGQVRQSLGISSDAPLIGTVGRLSEIKRQDILIRAFQLVLRRVPDAHLLIVGDGPAMGELRELVASLHIGARVHFVGYQPRPEAYLHAMDVFALSSRSEGMPLAVLEAWAGGVPVVATRVGGLPELIDDASTGVLVDFGDNDALAGALCDLIADTGFARRLGEAGKDRVESLFSLRRMADEYQRHYVELLGRREG
jgi:sugar transferase (PEP-CTERM/EpsH1 system associated)